MVTCWLTLLEQLTNRIKLIGKSTCAPLRHIFGSEYVSSLISKSANTLTNENEGDEHKLLFKLMGAEMNKLFSKMEGLQFDMSENMRYIKQQQNELTKENKQLLNDKIEILNDRNKALISENEENNNKIKEITQELNGIKEEKHKYLIKMNNEYKRQNNEMNIQIKQLNNKLNKQTEDNKQLIEVNKQLNNDKNQLNEKLNETLPEKFHEKIPETEHVEIKTEEHVSNNELILKRNVCPYINETIHTCTETGYESNENKQNNIEELYVKQILNIKSLFEHKKELGVGGTCTVSLVESNNNKYALKEISKSGPGTKFNEELFAREVQVLQLLSGQKYIIDYFDAYQTKEHYYLATHYCSGGTLLDPILNGETFSEKQCSKYIYQILTAIEHMHNKNLVHRDLKLENIIFDKENDTLKIIDFGDCEIIENNKIYKELVGTLYYLSPECKRERKGWEVKKSDMWSIGVILYILLSAQLPFPAYDNQEETLKSIEKGVFEWPNNIKLSESCKSFINGLLCKSTGKRFSAKVALKHEWIVGI